MSNEILAMEARLRDYLSQNLKTIESNLRGFTATQQKELQKQTRATTSTTRSVTLLKDTWKTLGPVIQGTLGIAAGYVVFQKITNQLKQSVEALKLQINAEQKLQSALKATNNQVGISYESMIEYSKSLQSVTTYGDEAVVAAQALMTTFTQVGQEVFPRAIEAGADMSAMFGQELQQSMIQLGTALNDPITGVGRLRRIGISFTEMQKESIKTFVEQNDIMSAQKVILDELNAEFGGVARQLAKTDVGKQEQLKNLLIDQKETLGTELIPLMNEWYDLLLKISKVTIGPLTDVLKGMNIELKLLKGQSLESVKTTTALSEAMKKSGTEGASILFNRLTKLKEGFKDLQNQLSAKENPSSIWDKIDKATGFSDDNIKRIKKDLNDYQEQITTVTKALKNMNEATLKTAQRNIVGSKPNFDGNTDTTEKGSFDDYAAKIGLPSKANIDYATAQFEMAQKKIENIRSYYVTSSNESQEKRLTIEKEYADRMNELYVADMNQTLQGRLQIISDNINNELALWQYYSDTGVITHKQYEDMKTELTKQGAEQRKQYILQEVEQTVSVIRTISSQWTSYLSAKRNAEYRNEVDRIKARNLSRKEEERLLLKAQQQNREAAKNEANIAVTMATINGALAFTKALTSSVPPMNFVNAGLVATATGLQIATMKKQRLSQGGYTKALLGEQGMEYVEGYGTVTSPSVHTLPIGTRVYNNTETKQMMGGNTFILQVPPGTAIDSVMANRIEEMAMVIGDVLITAQRDGRLSQYNAMRG